MFGAVLTLTAVVKMHEDGQISFQIYEGASPYRDFLSPLAMIYYQEVYRLLQSGDTLTVTVRATEGEQTMTASFGEGQRDYVFNEMERSPTPDLFPRIEEMYEKVRGLLRDGDTLSVIFQIKRL
jgi:hypothetical protein